VRCFGTKIGQKGDYEIAPRRRVRSASLTGLSRALQALRKSQKYQRGQPAKTPRNHVPNSVLALETDMCSATWSRCIATELAPPANGTSTAASDTWPASIVPDRAQCPLLSPALCPPAPPTPNACRMEDGPAQCRWPAIAGRSKCRSGHVSISFGTKVGQKRGR